jgi:hypothetical protein
VNAALAFIEGAKPQNEGESALVNQMKLGCSILAGPLAVAALIGSTQVDAEPHRIFWSQTGLNLGSPAIAGYSGGSAVEAMMEYEGGVLIISYSIPPV